MDNEDPNTIEAVEKLHLGTAFANREDEEGARDTSLISSTDVTDPTRALFHDDRGHDEKCREQALNPL